MGILEGLRAIVDEKRKSEAYCHSEPVIATDGELRTIAEMAPATEEGIRAIAGTDSAIGKVTGEMLEYLEGTGHRPSPYDKVLKQLETKSTVISTDDSMIWVRGPGEDVIDLVHAGIPAFGKEVVIARKGDECYDDAHDLVEEIKKKCGGDFAKAGISVCIGLVKGTAEGRSFRAPLALFQLSDARAGIDSVTVTLSPGRPAELNQPLVYALQTALGLPCEKVDTVLSGKTVAENLQDALGKLSAYGIEAALHGELVPEPLKAAKVSDSKAKGWTVEPVCLLGRFSNESNAVVRALEEIRALGDIGGPASRILSAGEGHSKESIPDLGSRSSYQTVPDKYDAEAIAGSKTCQIVFLHGGPGTGKSTIMANVVAANVADGNRCLIVASTETAQRVLFNKLGGNAFWVRDTPAANKAELERIVSLKADPPEDDSDYLSDKISNGLKRYEEAAYMYKPGDFGYTPAEAYVHGRDFADSGLADIFEATVDREALIPGDKVIDAVQAYSSGDVLSKVMRYMDFADISDLAPCLARADARAVGKLVAGYREVKGALGKASFGKKGALRKELKGILGEIASAFGRDKVSEADVDALAEGFDDIQSGSVTYTLIDAFDQRLLASVHALVKKAGMNAEEALTMLPDFALYLSIKEFEAAHPAADLVTSGGDVVLNQVLVWREQKARCGNQIVAWKFAQAGKKVAESKDIQKILRSRHGMGVRKMLHNCLEDLLEMPVWIASVDTVNRYFPLTPGLFDLVVFDETSVIEVADALKASVLGRHVIGAGDTLQHTNHRFFQRTAEVTEDLDDMNDSKAFPVVAKSLAEVLMAAGPVIHPC